MLDQVLDVFEIIPDVDLDLMTDRQTLASFTAKAIEELDKYFIAERPDLVLVQGDTSTVLCAALTAFYHKIPIGHVEAGLRTGDIYSPWPEEANRLMVSRLATYHFAPTEYNKTNLLNEGINEKQIFVTGNTVIDALFIALKKVEENNPVIQGLPGSSLEFIGDRKMLLITGHRRENLGDGFENICNAIRELAAQFPEVFFIYPVHLNPNVREPVYRKLGFPQSSNGTGINHNIYLIEPQSYLQFVSLMNRAYLILTDSGGVQEEAPSLEIPVLVMRNTTERPEGIAAGTSKLIGTNQKNIANEVSFLLEDENAYKKMTQVINPYGDGNATRRIITSLSQSQEFKNLQ